MPLFLLEHLFLLDACSYYKTFPSGCPHVEELAEMASMRSTRGLTSIQSNYRSNACFPLPFKPPRIPHFSYWAPTKAFLFAKTALDPTHCGLVDPIYNTSFWMGMGVHLNCDPRQLSTRPKNVCPMWWKTRLPFRLEHRPLVGGMGVCEIALLSYSPLGAVIPRENQKKSGM